MPHSQYFDRIDSYLKSVLNSLILRNLIVGWKEEVIKEGAGILHKIYRFRRDVECRGRVGFINLSLILFRTFSNI